MLQIQNDVTGLWATWNVMTMSNAMKMTQKNRSPVTCLFTVLSLRVQSLYVIQNCNSIVVEYQLLRGYIAQVYEVSTMM